MESCSSLVDVGLLAVVFGLYATKCRRDVILVLLICIVAHLALTAEQEDEASGGDVSDDEVVVSGAGVPDDEVVAKETSASPLGVGVVDSGNVKPRRPHATLSSSHLDRQLTNPGRDAGAKLLPDSSMSANGRLADARTSFFGSFGSPRGDAWSVL